MQFDLNRGFYPRGFPYVAPEEGEGNTRSNLLEPFAPWTRAKRLLRGMILIRVLL